MPLIKKIALLILINSLFFLVITQDFKTSLALIYGLLVALLVNVQSYRIIEKSVTKIYKGGNFALASLLLGEVTKFIFLWALLFIGYKGLGLAIKEMIFTFVFYYLFFTFYNLVQKRH